MFLIVVVFPVIVVIHIGLLVLSLKQKSKWIKLAQSAWDLVVAIATLAVKPLMPAQLGILYDLGASINLIAMIFAFLTYLSFCSKQHAVLSVIVVLISVLMMVSQI